MEDLTNFVKVLDDDNDLARSQEAIAAKEALDAVKSALSA